MNISFNILRVLYLIRNELWIKWRLYTMLLVIAILTSVMVYLTPSHDISQLRDLNIGITSNQTAGYFIDANGRVTTLNDIVKPSSLKYHLDWFPQLLFLIGCLFASLTFWEFRPGNSRSFHLNLPAMRVEKWFAKALITLVLFPLGFLIFYQLYATITYTLGTSQGFEFVRIGWFDPYIWKYLGYYLIIQSFFVLGGIFFTRYSVVKSLVLLTGFFESKEFFIAIGQFVNTGEYQSPWGFSNSLSGLVSSNASDYNKGILYIMDQEIWPHSAWFWGILFITITMVIVFYKFQELES